MRLALLIALAVTLSCGQHPNQQYVRAHVDGLASKPCIYWDDRNITYHVDPPADAERRAVDAAFATWQAVASSCSDLHFAGASGTADQNLVTWLAQQCDAVVPPQDPCLAAGTCDLQYHCWDGDSMTLAVTSVSYSRSTGKLSNADIKLNAADRVLTTIDSPACPKDQPATTCVANDVQNTVTHEVGHLLGFDHVSANNSTMSATAPLGDLSKRVIDPGTTAGLCAVYPRGAATPACAP